MSNRRFCGRSVVQTWLHPSILNPFILQWRTHMHALLTQSLKGDSDADGDEYSRSLDAQGEADMYLQAYTALMADRRAALLAERTLLAEHDGKEKKLRKTKAAKAATAA